MPFSLRKERRCVWVRYFDTLCVEEFVASVRQVVEDEDFDTLQFVVNDFVDVRAHDVDRDEVIEHIAVQGVGSAVTNPGYCIVVVRPDPRLLAVRAAVQALVGDAGPPVHFFDDREAALAWMAQQPLQS